ncbi:MAG: cell division protein ZapA [Bacillota bacterium]|nr:cell division protein ZapA [Bacillota bacterium]
MVNKVNVKIYGQEYIIAGEAPREDIIQCAAHVDAKMHEIAEAAKSAGASPQNVAILAAVNISSEKTQLVKELDDIKRMNAQLEKDAQLYVQLWDESKKTYSDYKDETQAIVLQKEEMLRQLQERENEIERLKAASAESQAQIQSGMEDMIKEVEDKCRELENSFFDLQMENLQLKKELDRYKNGTGQF